MTASSFVRSVRVLAQALPMGLAVGGSAMAAPCPYGPAQCMPGYVWREAFAGDVACVTPDVRAQAAADNAAAASRKVPNGQWGPDTCVMGYVWREANPTDHACVTGVVRSQTAADNAQAAARRDPACAVANASPINAAPTVPNANLNGFIAPPPGRKPAPAPIHAWNIVSTLPIPVHFQASGSTEVRCKTGQVATGGWANLDVQGRVLSILPLADGSGFRASAFNDGILPIDANLMVSAICADRPSGYEIRQTLANLSSHERKVVEAGCSPGKVLLGGGAATDDQLVFIASHSPRADGLAWTAFFRSDIVLPANSGAQVVSICADPGAVGGRHMAASSTAQLSPGSSANLTLGCGTGAVLSLGFQSAQSLVSQGSIPPPSSPGSWSGTVNNTSSIFDNVTAQVSLQAVCAMTQ